MHYSCSVVSKFKGVIIDNTKKLLVWIAIVSLLLVMCITVDSADNNIKNIDSSNDISIPNGIKVVDSSSFVDVNEKSSYFVANNNDKVHIIKSKKAKKKKKKPKKKAKKLPTIGMWAKPSVRSNYDYKWYYRTWINYCPNCHKYNSLLKNPKSVAEREYTCKYCDSDFCAVTGKEKYSWSRVYLKKA